MPRIESGDIFKNIFRIEIVGFLKDLVEGPRIQDVVIFKDFFRRIKNRNFLEGSIIENFEYLKIF